VVCRPPAHSMLVGVGAKAIGEPSKLWPCMIRDSSPGRKLNTVSFMNTLLIRLHEYIGSTALKFFDTNLGVPRESAN